jgi:fluoride exporter
VKDFILVFIGGGLGSVVRFGIGRGVSVFYAQSFPVATLVANITACFALGFFVGLADHRQLLSPASRLFWTVGFCGGFSTFSSFSQETLSLLQSNQIMSLLYVLASVLSCLGAVVAGLYVGKM